MKKIMMVIVLFAFGGLVYRIYTENEPVQRIHSSEKKESASNPIFVYKDSGNVQCEASQNTLSAMSGVLRKNKIQIYSQCAVKPSIMKIAACSASTGEFNVYKISEEDFEKIESEGFALWSKFAKELGLPSKMAQNPCDSPHSTGQN